MKANRAQAIGKARLFVRWTADCPPRPATRSSLSPRLRLHFGDKQPIGKTKLWNGVTQIPLFVRVPRITKAGAICKKSVSLVDLYPTLIDLCALPRNPHGDRFPSDGPPVAYNNCYSNAWTVYSDAYRYILDPKGNEELYDLNQDPDEWHNLAKDTSYKTRLAEMKRQLQSLSGGNVPTPK
jgi:arylsulfatase A-like enzyme